MFYKLVVLSCFMLSVGCSSDKKSPEAVTPAPKVEPAEVAQADPAAAIAPTPEFSVQEWGLVSYQAGEASLRSGPSAAPIQPSAKPTPAKLPVIRRSDLVAKKPVIYLKPGALWSAQTPIEVAVRFQGTGRLREVWPTPDHGAQPAPSAEFKWSRVHITDAPCAAGWAPAIDSAACTSLKDLSEGGECEGAQLERWVTQAPRCLDVHGTPAGALVYNGRPSNKDAPLEQISPGVWKNTSAHALGALLIQHQGALYGVDALASGAQWSANDQSMPGKQVKDAQAWARAQLKAQGLGSQESDDFMRAWSETLLDQARWHIFGFLSAEAIEAVATLKITPAPSKVTRVMAMTVEPQITAKPRLAEKRAAPLALPRLQLGDIKVVGGLDKAIVRRVVRRHLNELRYCYDSVLAREPELQGSLSVSFLISSRGAVMVAEVSSSTLKSSVVERCVTTKIRRWMFPSLQEGVSAKILLPMTFSR